MSLYNLLNSFTYNLLSKYIRSVSSKSFQFSFKRNNLQKHYDKDSNSDKR